MKIKALRPLNGHYGQKNPGEEFEVGETLGNHLVQRGLALKVRGPAPRRATADKVENKAASGPLDGSLTGGDALASSSPGDPPPPRSTSKRRVGRTRSSS